MLNPTASSSFVPITSRSAHSLKHRGAVVIQNKREEAGNDPSSCAPMKTTKLLSKSGSSTKKGSGATAEENATKAMHDTQRRQPKQRVRKMPQEARRAAAGTRRRVGVERSKVQHPQPAEASPFRVHHDHQAQRRDRIFSVSLFLSVGSVFVLCFVSRPSCPSPSFLPSLQRRVDESSPAT